MKDERLIAKVASLYYLEGLTQQEIGDRMRLSRQMVSRMLQAARSSGLVQIQVNQAPGAVIDLERELEERFRLNEAYIVTQAGDDPDKLQAALGQAGATYLARQVSDGDTIGISWGTTLAKVAENLMPQDRRDVKVVQLNGGIALGGHVTNAGSVLQAFSTAFNGKAYSLDAPAIVDTEEISQAIRSASAVWRVLKMSNQANICVFPVGALTNFSVLVEAGYVSRADVDRLRRLGAVGDICSRYIDIEGRIADPELNRRTIGIELDALPSRQLSIAIAGGHHKVKAILGALNGGYCNVLITDEATARQILQDGDSRSRRDIFPSSKLTG